MISSSSSSFLAARICPSLLFILFSLFCTTYGYRGSSAKISYNDHCASVVPESSSTVRAQVDDLQALEKWTSYYTGGEGIFGRISSSSSLSSSSSASAQNISNYSRSLTFYTTRNVYETITPGVYKIEAYLKFQSPVLFGYNNYSTLDLYRNNSSQSSRRRKGQLVFLFNGFWSASTRKLCMVGSASRQSETGGRLLQLEAVLKLKYAPEKSTIFTSVVNGKLESLSPPKASTYFHPVKIVSFPLIRGYNFTLVSKDEGGGGGCLGGVNNAESLDLKSGRICSYLSGQPLDFVLDYAPGCNGDSINCSPLQFQSQMQGDVPYLPRMISLSVTQCFQEEEKLRYIIRFPNNSDSWYSNPLDPKTTLIGEGSLQRKKNQMCIVACRILNPSTISSGDASVGDCSIRMCLRFPSVLTINSTSVIVGEIWTNNSVNSPGYFKKIMYRSLGDYEYLRFSGLKYEYTEVTKARESCSVKEPARRGGGKYPKGNSNDMRFQLSIKHSGEQVGWADAKPISVGGDIYEGNIMIISDWEEGLGHSHPVIDEDEGNGNSMSLMNISYNIILNSFLDFNAQISSLNYSLSPKGSLEITAEGVYDAERGLICMVGCRQLYSYSYSNNKQSLDCEILVNIEFPSQNSSQNSYIEGSIQSRRPKTDPLYFDRLNISSYYYSISQAEELIWRMDLEIIMVLISNSLACIFVVLQIFHVRKHPEKLPFISMAMLTILTLGYFIPLVLNFEALILKNQYQHNVIFRGSGWLEVNEMSVRLVTMIAFLLLSRLLQLAWNSRLADGIGNVNHHSWTAEKRVLFVSLPLYIAGGLITILVSLSLSLKKNNYQQGIDLQQESTTTTLEYLRSYSGLIVDGFLLPQILLNMFQSSKQHALSKPFYLGITLVRLLPHGYDLYRIHTFIHRDFNGSYIYANPDADFYSIAWDVIILGGCILFGVIIWMQQRFGGRCILPGKLKELELL